MAPNHSLNLRLSPAQYRMLERLVEKLHISKTDVIRFALTRLAEAEGLLYAPPSQETKKP